MPSIGIIGAGQISAAIATALARRGIPATIANSRGPESLADTVAALGRASRRVPARRPPRRTSSSSL